MSGDYCECPVHTDDLIVDGRPRCIGCGNCTDEADHLQQENERLERDRVQVQYAVTQFCRAAQITPQQRKRLLQIVGGEWPNTTGENIK